MRIVSVLLSACLMASAAAGQAPSVQPVPQTTTRTDSHAPNVLRRDTPLPGRDARLQAAQACTALAAELTGTNQAANERLSNLVARMNEARASEKLDRMAEVIEELVAQRVAIRQESASAERKLIGHVLRHVQESPLTSLVDSIAACPVLTSEGTRVTSPQTPDGATPRTP